MATELAFLSRAGTWDAFYTEARVAKFRRRLYLEAFGGEYPSDAATDGYVTRTELRQLADALQVGPGCKVADLGCGRGAPGQWVARTTGANLIGIDISEVAIEQARVRADQAGITDAVSYQTGSFDATGLGSSSFDG